MSTTKRAIAGIAVAQNGANVDRMGIYGEKLPAAVAAQLRAEKAARSMSLDEIAQLSGVGKRTLQRYLSGERQIPIDAMCDVAEALGLSPRELMARAEQRIK
ncbi:helix-turn-helix domain-containing protein [Arthrobacter woluwensis]|uniref:Helix-turn-helix n=1 Tax=Arthrobacter woluwensis TaxID=156980 RepID=A0A1H4WTB6_9MICC|nr:helix-turn-helix transcriptional regulator [Arthrobacter woluwensis]SEC89228.1 Helix-turn-helix [Arthrobacter woluwensis]SEC96270.1 Helix-turn-helix [Arthrobacter woluwensis]